MRTTKSLFLFSLILLNLFGFYFAFTLEQMEIQKEMFSHRGTGQTLSLSKAEYAKLVWLHNKKEMRFNGKLYDVTSIEITATSVNLLVEEDNYETILIDKFISAFHLSSDKTANSSPVKIRLQHFMQEFIATSSASSYSPSLSISSFLTKECAPTSFVSIGQSPPPDCFWS